MWPGNCHPLPMDPLFVAFYYGLATGLITIVIAIVIAVVIAMVWLDAKLPQLRNVAVRIVKFVCVYVLISLAVSATTAIAVTLALSALHVL